MSRLGMARLSMSLAPAKFKWTSPTQKYLPTSNHAPNTFGCFKTPSGVRPFNRGFHCDRGGGTIPLAMLSVFLQAKIALILVQPEASANKASPQLAAPHGRLQ